MNLRLSSKQIQTFAVLFCMIVMNISLSARADNSPLLIKDLGEGHCLVRVNTNQKYLLLPVEDASPDVRISMIVNNKEVKNFDVRLAIHKVDYFVPVDLSDYSGKLISFKFKMNSNDVHQLLIEHITLGDSQHTLLVQHFRIEGTQFVQQDFVFFTNVVAVCRNHKQQ